MSKKSDDIRIKEYLKQVPLDTPKKGFTDLILNLIAIPDFEQELRKDALLSDVNMDFSELKIDVNFTNSILEKCNESKVYKPIIPKIAFILFFGFLSLMSLISFLLNNKQSILENSMESLPNITVDSNFIVDFISKQSVINSPIFFISMLSITFLLSMDYMLKFKKSNTI